VNAEPWISLARSSYINPAVFSFTVGQPRIRVARSGHIIIILCMFPPPPTGRSLFDSIDSYQTHRQVLPEPRLSTASGSHSLFRIYYTSPYLRALGIRGFLPFTSASAYHICEYSHVVYTGLTEVHWRTQISVNPLRFPRNPPNHSAHGALIP
jgi:hypothetical protein